MPVSARTLKALMEAGVCGDKLVEIVGLIDADMTPPKDTAAERRRAYDRERKRNSTGTSTGASLTNSTGTSTGSPPETPISRVEDNLLSTEIPGKKENKNLVDFGFEQFWRVCPRKAGKGAARTAWVRACRKADPPTILAGLERAKLGWRDVEPQFIPHPATWLNQERWLDEPPGNGPPGVRLVQDEDFTRRGLERLRQTGLIADG